MRNFILILLFTQTLYAQISLIEITRIKDEYLFKQSISFMIKNKTKETIIIMVGLEKYSNYDSSWKKITDNILMNKDESLGNAKGGLSYFVMAFDSVFVEQNINQIFLPFYLINYSKLLKKKNISKKSILTGKFRFSIKYNILNQDENIIIKTEPFFIQSPQS